MSTRPGGSFTAPRVDITALLSDKCKAQAHNRTVCQNKYSKEIETTHTCTYTHILCEGMLHATSQAEAAVDAVVITAQKMADDKRAE